MNDAPRIDPVRLIPLMAASAGLAVATIYFNQPLLETMARSFRVGLTAVAPVAMATQLGYAAGLFVLGPMGDRLPRKGIILVLGIGLTLASLAAAVSPTAEALIGASLGIGLFASLAQQIVPMAAHLAPPEQRGRIVGKVMSGLLFGILGGRFVAGVLGAHVGWRGVFLLGAAGAAGMTAVLAWRLPKLPPVTHEPPGRLILSVFALAGRYPALRAASFTGALLFAAFSVFWVALTPLLASAFHLGSQVAGLFGLIGATGALIAPIAGRLTDRIGPGKVLTAGIAGTFASFVVFAISGRSLVGLAVGSILLDGGTQAALIANQARIFALAPSARSRTNSFFMTCYFLGGSAGSVIAGHAWAYAGWTGASVAGLALTAAAGVAHALWRVPTRREAPSHAG
jgi:predicted MFS family arabinose efflux permease